MIQYNGIEMVSSDLGHGTVNMETTHALVVT